MALRLVKSCLWLTLLLLCLGPATPSDQKSEDLTEELFTSLNRVLDFFKRDYRSINLDGIFGLRVAQGAFLAIINEVKDGQLNVEDSVLKQVKGLHTKASIIGQDALPYLRESAPDYFVKFKKQVSYPWSNFKPFTDKKLTKRQYNPESRRNAIDFDENTSDECMTGLTGTASEGSQSCQISDKCWSLISAEGAEGYTLTHQALFFQLGETQGCTPIFQKRLQKSKIKGGLEEVYNRICSDMYPEMTATEMKRTLDESIYQRDLYMEQSMVCGSLGYRDFLSTERLKRILSWQRDDGCFGRKKVDHEEDDEDDDDDVIGQESDIIKEKDKDSTEKREFNSPFGNMKKGLVDEYSQVLLRKPLGMRTMRSLLVEKELNDGCLSHITGVATGLLGVYLRWLLYSHKQPIQKHNELDTRKSLQNQETEVYGNENLIDAIARKEDQLEHDLNKLKQDQLHSAHLMRMRKAAMLEKSALLVEKNVEERGGEGSGIGRVLVIVFGSILLLVLVLLGKGFKRMPGMVRMFTRMKKHAHVI